MRSKNRNFNLVVVGALLCVTTCAISPAPTHAANGWDIDLKNYADTLGESSISISIGGANNEILNADKGVAQGMIKQTANVEFGATNGYTVKISGTPNLTGASTKATIPSAALTLGNMVNQWGWYAVNGAADCSETNVYKAMTSAGTQIDSGVLTDGGTKTYTMCFGMRVNGNQAADTYNGSVTVSAVAEPGTIRTSAFSGITYMQDMTPNICKLADENETAQLIDRRDNKKYWVTKLLDGNCWMSQNLALDLSTSKPLTSADSDVASSWTPGRNTTTYAASENTNDNEAYSWNLGSYIANAPTRVASCQNSNADWSACQEQGFVSVEGWMASDAPNFYRQTNYNGTGGGSCTKAANSAANDTATGECRVYDAHYLVGNYYSWKAATANTGGAVSNTNATESICPKGWKLPSSGNNTTKGAFGYMLSQYGVMGHSSGVSDFDNNDYNIVLSPLFFIRSGYIQGSDSFAGYSGNYWSATPRSYNAMVALSLSIENTTVNPSNNTSIYPRYYYGYSLRCLVPTT